MLLLFDNYDSFTYNLKDYFEQLGEPCLVVRNNELSLQEIAQLNFDKIVISPGPKRPKDAGILNELIAHYHSTTPILGICLGHQALGEFFGAKLVKAHQPMHGKVSEIEHTGADLFIDIPLQFEACRYHSLVLEQIPPEFKIIAKTKEQEVMAIQHSRLPLWGVQFHPEAILTPYGMKILDNWLSKCVGF